MIPALSILDRRLQRSHSALKKEGGSFIEIARGCGRVHLVSFRKVYDHPLSRSGQQHTVGVLPERTLVGILDVEPPVRCARPERAELPPIRVVPHEITTPADSDPIEFKSLYFEFGREDLTLVARTNVRSVGEIPVLPWVLSMECGTRLEPLCAKPACT